LLQALLPAVAFDAATAMPSMAITMPFAVVGDTGITAPSGVLYPASDEHAADSKNLAMGATACAPWAI
jgi:hypothetical protein